MCLQALLSETSLYLSYTQVFDRSIKCTDYYPSKSIQMKMIQDKITIFICLTSDIYQNY